MHHKLDITPIPDSPTYINELSIADRALPFETTEEVAQAITGKTISQGGLLPEDNVRIYVPLDLSEEAILHRLYTLFQETPTEKNESRFVSEVARLINQLEIYDQVWAARKHGVQKEPGGVVHSRQGIELAQKMIAVLNEKDSDAESFLYDQIDELKSMFWLR